MFRRNVLWLLTLKSFLNMLPPISVEMDVNSFSPVLLPSKAQIFSRTGKKSQVAGAYTGDDSAHFNGTTIDACEKVARTAENYESPKPAEENNE